MLDYDPNPQRVTISATPHTNSGTWAPHGKYLQRDGARLSQEHGRGWGTEGGIDLITRLTEWKEAGETLLHKLVISPESARGVDLRDFTAALVSRIEQDTGQQLAWCAIEHHNTKHDHVHLLVRGTARGGAPLRLSSAYLRTELQAFAAERLTDIQGYRSAREQDRGRQTLATTCNKTSLDTELWRISDQGTGAVDMARAPETNRPALLARMEFLERLGLADAGHLDPEFRHTLRAIGLQYNKQASRARGRVTPSAPDLPVVILPLQAKESVVGVLIDAGRHNDTPWALLEFTTSWSGLPVARVG